ncbi:hypothetical protein M5D96_007944 [Drosophila gunungcola]|uniref:Uncharacterized protein n=1 Tax=Drosophila gunungcola TaxID=103775 RepID=A0A9P9YLI7_9MUSC|nr:hypothetical protein M5D96_007944 [Drosophila gunungcola]
MMQRCSELGKNSMAWQHLVRFGRSNLKVKKGPSGHYLEKRCRDELEKSLPAESFKELMVFVAKWLKRLDDKNGMKHQKEAAQPDTAAKTAVEKPGGIQAPTNPAVVDLCSDGEDEKPNVCMLDNEPLDSDSVISSSSIVILDDELGEVNLKDYADHVDGKLDAAALKKRNSVDEERTTSKARKQTTIKEFLTPKKTLPDTSPPSALRRSLKTCSTWIRYYHHAYGSWISERFWLPTTQICARNPSSKHHPPLPAAPAPVVTPNYQQINPVSPAPATSSSIQPNIPAASAPLGKSSYQLTGGDPRSDLANIMGMLAQVELFAYGQKNQEAFHLVNQLRISLQRGAAQSCQARQRKA